MSELDPKGVEAATAAFRAAWSRGHGTDVEWMHASITAYLNASSLSEAGDDSPAIYIDCEFNGFGGQLLSFAMVADDGREFYSVLPQPSAVEYDPWVVDNVVPVFGKAPVARYSDFRVAFLEFIRGFRNPTIIADWPADLYYFNQVLLGPEYEQSVLVPCTMQLVNCDYVSAVQHNALEDARAIRSAAQSPRDEVK